MIIITFGTSLSDDIETLRNPRMSNESKISNASTRISLHSIFIVTFPHTSVMDLVTCGKSIKINAYLMTRDDSKRRTNVTIQRFESSVHVVWCMNEVKLSTNHDRREHYRKLFRHQITNVNKMTRYIWSVENHSTPRSMMIVVSNRDDLPFQSISCWIQCFRNKTKVKITSATFSDIMILVTFINTSSESWSILNTIRKSLISDDEWHEDPRYVLTFNRTSNYHVSW